MIKVDVMSCKLMSMATIIYKTEHITRYVLGGDLVKLVSTC